MLIYSKTNVDFSANRLILMSPMKNLVLQFILVNRTGKSSRNLTEFEDGGLYAAHSTKGILLAIQVLDR